MDRKLIISSVIVANIYIGYKAFLLYLVGAVFVFFPKTSNEYEGIQSLVWMLPLGLTIIVGISLLIIGANYICYYFFGSELRITRLKYSFLISCSIIIGNVVALIVRCVQ